MTTHTIASQTASAMRKAAAAFLAGLSPQQRAKAVIDFDSDERQNWHYVPKPREGLPRLEMTEAQLEAADVLIASGLNERAFQQARDIIELEHILRGIQEAHGRAFDAFHRGLYYFSVFGDPDGMTPWGWRVEGHHLSLNFTVVNGDVVSPTPSFFGAHPAEVEEGPRKGLRVLQAEEELARGLLHSLDLTQRKDATISEEARPEFTSRASRRVEVTGPLGLRGEAMSGEQRDILMSLVRVYVERKPSEVAGPALKKIEAEGIANLHFGWSGGEHRHQPHYYRIHGPSFFVEYDNTQDRGNHIHSVWRDRADDFGLDVLRRHYRQDHS